MNINQRPYKVKKRGSFTQPDQVQENPHMRNSIGQQAKQQLRQISQKYQMESQIVRDLQWSAKPQKHKTKNISHQGFFEINLSKINAKNNKAESKLYKLTRQSYHEPKQQKIALQLQQSKLIEINKRRKSHNYASINYQLKGSRYKQSRIHSISEVKVDSKDSYFIVDQQVFKEAAIKLQKKLHSTRIPFNLQSQKQDRVQSQLIVRRKVQKSPETENASLCKVNYISISPHNIPSKQFTLSPPIHPIKKRKVNFPIKLIFNHRSKNIS